MAGDHPGIPYLEALKTDGKPMYTKGRPDGPPLWIVIHDMEEEELPDMAERVAQYFHTGAGGRSVSSHYTADSNSIVQCVLLANSAWTVGNRQGNNRGINWELTGFGAQTRSQWLDSYGKAMFALIAPIIKADAARFNIPLRTLTDDQVRAYQPGITSHWQLGRAFGGTDHTDPGPNFPWDYLMSLLTGPTEDDMASSLVIEDINSPGAYYVLGGDGVVRPLPKTANGPADIGYVLSGRWAPEAGQPPLPPLPYGNEIINSVPWIKIPKLPINVWPKEASGGGGGPTDLTPVLKAIGEVDKKVVALTPEIRDAVADLGEGGAKQVRADA